MLTFHSGLLSEHFPSSLAKYVRDAEAELLETKGMFYNPLTHKANLNNDLGVNYLMYARKS